MCPSQSLDTLAVRNALDQVFDERPNSDPIAYYFGGAFELRKSLNDQGKRRYAAVGESITSGRPQSRRSSIYEMTLLREIIDSDQAVTVIRGGTGSGKSSLLLMFREFFSEMLRERIRARSSESDFANHSDFVAIIDLQDPDQDLQITKSNLQEQNTQFVKLARDIAARLSESLKMMAPEAILPSVIRRAFTGGMINKADRSAAVRHAVNREVFRRQNRTFVDIPDADIPYVLDAAVDDLICPETMILAMVMPFVVLAEQVDSVGGRIMIAFDNLDALPSYLQRRTWATLNTLFAAKDPEENVPLRLLLFLRISSSIDNIGAFPRPHVFSHACVNPVDLVLHRCVRFLLGEGDYSQFDNLPAAVQEELRARLAMLVFWLHDRTSTMSQALNCLAGSNIRNAFSQVKEWLVVPHLIGRAFKNCAFQSLEANLSSVVVAIRCEDAGEWFVHGVQSHISSETVEQLVSELCVAGDVAGRRVAVDGILSPMMQIAASCLRDGGFFTETLPSRGKQMVGPPLQVKMSDFDIKVAESLLMPQRSSALAVGLRETIDSWRSEYDLRNAGGDDGAQFEATMRAIGDHFHSGLANFVKKYCNENSFIETTASKWKVRHFAECVKKVFGESSSRPKYLSVTTSVEDSRKRLRAMRRLLELSGHASSRFTIAHALLHVASEEAYQTQEEAGVQAILGPEDQPRYSAANVFALDPNNVCAVALRILARLNHARYWNEFTVSSIHEDLLRHGFNEYQMQRGLTELIRRDRRLVFSTAEDEAMGASRLCDDMDRPFNLSWCGHDYFHNLVRMPAYLQWCLNENQEVIDHESALLEKAAVAENFFGIGGQHSVLGRLWRLFVGLELVVNKEIREIETIKQRIAKDVVSNEATIQSVMRRNELPCLVISFDIYMDVLTEVVLTIKGHVKKSGYSEAGSKLIELWICFAESRIDHAMQLFGVSAKRIGTWGQSLRSAKQLIGVDSSAATGK